MKLISFNTLIRNDLEVDYLPPWGSIIGTMEKEIEKLIYSNREVCAAIGIAQSTLYRWQKNGIFPKRIKLGPVGNPRGRCGFLKRDVEAFLLTRPAA